ncbi:unnamed protein product [Paramecium primaurelia]|uniref:Uncharacterized protein n=1 Tax=Paramecium primaurelia TaxID=5886 RepID=A0A8S1JLF9_PARPR|nr:unnamed protein product [Paramecium primaurelia]
MLIKMLGNYYDAIIWNDKALLINSNHFNVYLSKLNVQNILNNYNDAIIWADKVLSIDQEHINLLQTKGFYFFLIKVNHYIQ